MATYLGGLSTRESSSNTTAIDVELITITSSYTAADITYIAADASLRNITITLPSAAAYGGRQYQIKRKDSSGNTVTIVTSDGQNIDDNTSFSMTGKGVAYNFIADSYSGGYLVF